MSGGKVSGVKCRGVKCRGVKCRITQIGYVYLVLLGCRKVLLQFRINYKSAGEFFYFHL